MPSIDGLKKGWKLAKYRKNPLNKKRCLICGKTFYRRGKKKYTAKCCSRECCNIYRTGKTFLKKKNSIKVKKVCVFCNKEFLSYPSTLKKNGGKFCSIQCRNKLWKGKNHPLYKGGSRSDKDMIYHSKKYQDWRRRVFIRDSFTCVECGVIGGKLEAHHIKQFALYPKLRFSINNGVTLCRECHRKTEGWLRYYGKKTI